jgi:hypothetical protein
MFNRAQIERKYRIDTIEHKIIPQILESHNGEYPLQDLIFFICRNFHLSIPIARSYVSELEAYNIITIENGIVKPKKKDNNIDTDQK